MNPMLFSGIVSYFRLSSVVEQVAVVHTDYLVGDEDPSGEDAAATTQQVIHHLKAGPSLAV